MVCFVASLRLLRLLCCGNPPRADAVHGISNVGSESFVPGPVWDKKQPGSSALGCELCTTDSGAVQTSARLPCGGHPKKERSEAGD